MAERYFLRYALVLLPFNPETERSDRVAIFVMCGMKTIKNIAKKILSPFLRRPKGVSHGYRIIENPDRDALRERYNAVWQDISIPQKQLEITEKQLPGFHNTGPMKAAVDLLRKTGLAHPGVLEIGCSTGYYYDVFKKAGLDVAYEGCDYSEEFIKVARQKHPGVQFKVSNALALDYRDSQFDIAISGCCILHIIDYPKAIAETARVAKTWTVFHRTPVVHMRQTTYAKKIGYDIEMLEILFNEEELFGLFAKNGLAVHSVNTHGQFFVPGIAEPVFMKSYLCKKI